MIHRLLLVALIAGASPAFAQNQPPPPVTMPAVPPPNCVKPEYPGKLASNTMINAFNKNYKVYGDCIKKYLDDVKTLTNAAIEAGNKAVDEYNKYTNDIKAEIEAGKQ